jgi:transglutaminase-like putative cysteine protease
MAIPMTLAGFWLFPRLASPLWGLPENSVGRMSLGDRMRPNEWLDELVDDSPAMRARFIGATPPRRQMYWRGPVLTQFDGEAWTRDPAALQAPPPVIVATGVQVAYEVMLEPTERRDLLVLDWPLGAPEGARLNSDMTARVGEPVNNLVRYAGRSAVSTRFSGELPAWQRHSALLLPRNHDPRTRALALQWRQATPDPLQLSRRFLAWMRRDFKYSISAPPVGFHATDEFLFDTRVGFCQHFSSAFAVFMRAAGVPARVVTGYVGGHYNKIGDYWLLKHKDAHAWTEIWIDGQGWVRVDPTAAIAPGNILDTLDDLQARQQGGLAGAASQIVSPMLDGSDFLRRQWNELILGFNASRQQGLLRPFGVRSAEAWQLVAAFGVGSALALALTLWFLLREHRDRSHPIIQAWRSFTRRLRRAGYGKAANEPPLGFARRVAGEIPSGGEVLALSQRYSDWRYAGDRLEASQQLALIKELRAFRISSRNRTPRSPP